MIRRILVLFIIATLGLNCSKTDKEQNLDISVTGAVTDQNNRGIANVTIYIERGKWGNFIGPVYDIFETIKTNASGSYNYLVKNDGYSYKVFCVVPSGYSIVGERCVYVDHSIVNYHTLPNTINFKLIQ